MYSRAPIYTIAYDNRPYATYGSNTSNIQRIINDTRISNSFVGVNYRFLMSELYCV